MKLTESIHALEIPFKVPVAPKVHIDRTVFTYLIFGKKITLIDSGVAGAESIISPTRTSPGPSRQAGSYSNKQQ